MENKLILEPFQPGTVKPEADYLELERLSRKLGIPVPMMFINVAATNPDGSPGQSYEGRSRTFNRNFWNYALGIMAITPAGTLTFGAGYLAVKNISGTVFAMTQDDVGNNNRGGQFLYGPAVATMGSLRGIVVGIGTTAESFEHVALATPLEHGNYSGKISYSTQAVTVVSYNSGTKVWTATLARIFNNNSGGTLVVSETGIYALPANTNGLSSEFMLCRDLLGATVSVLDAGQLTVTYTMTLTFPA